MSIYSMLAEITQLSSGKEISIKPLDNKDAAELALLHTANNYPGEKSVNTALNKRKFLGAFADDTLVGFISYDVVNDPGLICNLLIDGKYRRHGIGKMLVQAAEKDLVEKGIATAYLHVRTTNATAKKAYDHLGYSVTNTLKNYYKRNPGDAYEMNRHLIENS